MNSRLILKAIQPEKRFMINKTLPDFCPMRRCTVLKLNSVIFVLFFSFESLSADPFATERTIIRLSQDWHKEMMIVAEYEGLKSFCSNDLQRQIISSLLDEIHYYHDVLEADLQSTTYNHSGRTIRRLLKEIDKFNAEYHPEDFADFFREQCWLRSRTEKNAKRYNTGFGTHSYGGMVYSQEVVADWYLKRLSKKIGRIQKHVEHFYIQRIVRERNIESSGEENEGSHDLILESGTKASRKLM